MSMGIGGNVPAAGQDAASVAELSERAGIKAVLNEGRLDSLDSNGRFVSVPLDAKEKGHRFRLLKDSVEGVSACWDVVGNAVYHAPVWGDPSGPISVPLLKIARDELVADPGGDGSSDADLGLHKYLGFDNQVMPLHPLVRTYGGIGTALRADQVHTDLLFDPRGRVTLAIETGTLLRIETLDLNDLEKDWQYREYMCDEPLNGFVIKSVTPRTTTIVAADGQTYQLGTSGVKPVGRVQRDAKRPDQTFLIVDKRRATPEVLRYTVTDDVISYRSGTRAARGDDATIAGALKRSLQVLKTTGAE